MILKYYNTNKKLSNKPTYISIEKHFGTDNYLIQTLKRTSKFQNDKKLSEYENSLHDLIQYIYKTILFKNNPKIKILSEENEEFLKPYKYLSKTFEAQTEQVLQDLIIKYTQRGYRIPKFSYKNNIFKINTLIEENTEKLRLMLIEELKRKENYIGPKNLMYLNKLFYLVQIMSTSDQNVIKKYTKLLNKKEPFPRKSKVDALKKEIEDMLKLTSKLKLNKIGVEQQRKSSFLSNIPNLKNFKILKFNNKGKELNNNINKNYIRTNTNTNINDNTANNGITSTEESSGNMKIKRRNPYSFMSMRLTNFGTQSTKLVSSLFSKNKITPLENAEHINTENNNNSFKNNNLTNKENTFINLKIKNFNSNQTSNNERIKTPSQREKKEFSHSTKRKNTYSDLTKYIAQAKKNKYYQSEKNNNYALGLKRNHLSIKRNEVSSQKENHQVSGYSFDTVNINYKLKRNSIKKDTLSRNENFQSELKEMKKGLTEKSEEKKSNFLWNAYRKIRRGKYEDVEEYMRKYLREIKEMNSKDEEIMMQNYDYKNLRNNLFELNSKVNEDSTRKKIEKIYSNIHKLKRVAPSLALMKEKEYNIDRLEKIYTSGINK